MSRFIFLSVNGVTFGLIYAAVALSLVLIYRTTRVLNFAQGAMAVASAYVALSVINHTGSYWLGFAAALASGALIGATAQLTVFRTAEKQPHLTLIVIGIGLLILIQAVLGMIYGATERRLDAAFSQELYKIGEIPVVSRQDLFIIGSVSAVMLGLAYLITKTSVGLKMRAAAFAPEIARLQGVRVSRMLTLGWVLAGVGGALSAMLVVPTGLGLFPQAMDTVLVLGFTAAVLGGLDSPVGAVVGGVVTGLTLSYTSGYVSSELTYLAALTLLLGVLLVKPDGLFSGVKARRV